MTIKHPIFCRRVDKDKVLLMTVVDTDSVEFDEDDDDVFFIATTSNANIYTGMSPTIILDRTTKMDSEQYVKYLNEESHMVDKTKGLGIEGIAKGQYWFIQKFKSLVEKALG
jgi:hypothetical protein